MIAKPKPRFIQAAPFVDRVVHHSLSSILAPYLERSYLADSYACQKGKGNHRAIKRAQKLLRRFSWVGKIDIYHFFESLDHPTLFRLLRKRIQDKRTMALIQKIISHGHSSISKERGVPIGNLTSQHFANFYLDSLDHYIVEQTPISAMVRYMDDVLIFSHEKRHILDGCSMIDDFVQSKLKLKLKDSQTQLQPSYRGVPFLGFRIFENMIRFDGARKHRFILKWKKLLSAASKENITEKELSQSFNSLFAWSDQANTRQLIKNLLSQKWAR